MVRGLRRSAHTDVGKLGHESEEDVLQPRAVKFSGNSPVTCLNVSASDRHSCVVTSSGDLYTFGYGMEGCGKQLSCNVTKDDACGRQLGHSSFANYSKPKLVTSVRNAVSASASKSHTAVATASGKEVYLFGCGVGLCSIAI